MDDVAREIAEKAARSSDAPSDAGSEQDGGGEEEEEGGLAAAGGRGAEGETAPLTGSGKDSPLEAVDQELGDSALSLALRRGDESMASALVALGADPRHRPVSWQAAALEGTEGQDTCLQAAVKLGFRSLAIAMVRPPPSPHYCVHARPRPLDWPRSPPPAD